MDTGNLVAAIELTIAYYNGKELSCDNSDAFNANLGLPMDDDARKDVVEPKLREILSASTEYVFSEDRMHDSTHVNSDGTGRGVDRTTLFEQLVDSATRASLAVDNFDFLFEDLYDKYSAQGIKRIFLDRLEPFILDNLVQTIPTGIIQQLLTQHEERDELQQAESLIWHVKPECLDVNQTVRLCSSHRLYNALIYVYTRALADFVGPFVELLTLVRLICIQRLSRPQWVGEALKDSMDDSYFNHLEHVEALVPDAYKVYSYLADSLVGLTHPNKESLPKETALKAKTSLYTFVFSDGLRAYPDGSQGIVEAGDEDAAQVLNFPYLRLLLRFDAEALLDCLDIAFEDSYLNEEFEGHTPDRQQIIDILLSISHSSSSLDFTTADRTILNIFIARNLPKYSQFVHLPSATLHQILLQLATDPDLSSQEDRQLAVEFLLSIYGPAYDTEILGIFNDAGFFRILESIYRLKRQWRNLVSVYIRDPHQNSSLFYSLAQVFRDARKDTDSDLAEVEAEIVSAVKQLVELDVKQTAILFERYMPVWHASALQKLENLPLRQMAYLRALLEPIPEESQETSHVTITHLKEEQKSLYIALLCKHDAGSIVQYLAKNPDLDKHLAIQICEEKEIYEAVIWLQAQADRVEESLLTMRNVLKAQSEVIAGSFSVQDSDVSSFIGRAVRTAKMAIQVCIHKTGQLKHSEVDNLWFILLTSLVEFLRAISSGIRASSEGSHRIIVQPLQALLPEALSALVSSTSSRTISFPHLMRRLMGATSAITYSDYRDIVNSMLDTYRFEDDLLQASNRLIEADLFELMVDLSNDKIKGWRPDVSSRCEACGKPIFTKVMQHDRFSNTELVPKSASSLDVTDRMKARPGVRRRPSLKGKETDWYEEPVDKASSLQGLSVVVFRGGAICHATCLYHTSKI